MKKFTSIRKLLILALACGPALHGAMLHPFQALRLCCGTHNMPPRKYAPYMHDAYACHNLVMNAAKARQAGDRTVLDQGLIDVLAYRQYSALMALFENKHDRTPVTPHEMGRVLQCLPDIAQRTPEFMYVNLLRARGTNNAATCKAKRELLAYYRAETSDLMSEILV